MKKQKKIIALIIVSALITGVLVSQTLLAAPNYNYGEALQKSILFYEFQRSGTLPDDIRNNWRGDSGVNDGSDVGKDLTGGWYDAGDHVKFNLPMSYTAAMLAWSVYEDKDAYEKSGQLKYILKELKWVNDYFIKCHTGPNEYYYQVGDGNADHSWWGPAEVMQMDRPSYKVTKASPGSTVVAETAASLAAASLVFKDEDPSYSAKCLKHAKELYDFAASTLSDDGYKAAENFYKSWSGFYDELSWAGAWLAMATGDETYIEKAESYVDNWGRENQTDIIAYKWAHCWDDVHYGAVLLLARLTGKSVYTDLMERSLDYWTTGYNGEKVTYSPKGLAWMSEWGALRYASTMAFLADVYAEWDGCNESKVSTYQKFAKEQTDYALGSTGRSYVVGFGQNPPKRPHHRTAHASWADSQTVPDYHRHTLYGALVGGPNSSDAYEDDIGNYITNEVACDYNAGFTGILARMYNKHGGSPIKDFKAIEEVTNDEFYVEAGINAKGDNFTEIRAYLYNHTGWPARMGDKLSFNYYVNLSEFFEAGYTTEDVTISVNYNNGSTVSGLKAWDKANNIYYVTVDFTGAKIYPGGQQHHKKEIQFRIAAPDATKFWNPDNDYSFKDIEGATGVKTENIPVYDDGKLVFGKEPEKGGTSETTKPVTTEPVTTVPVTTEPVTTVPVTTEPVTTEPVTTAPVTTEPATTTNPTIPEGDYLVSYKLQNDWGVGATVSVEVSNNTNVSINGWELVWDFNGNQEISSLWSAKFSQVGKTVTVNNESWNGIIGSSEKINFGFNLIYSGSNEIPSEFKLNGEKCVVE